MVGGALDVGGLLLRNQGNSFGSVDIERGDFTLRKNQGDNGTGEGVIRLKDSTFTIISGVGNGYLPLAGELFAEGSTIRLEAGPTFISRGHFKLIDTELLISSSLGIEGSTSEPSSLLLEGSMIRRESGAAGNVDLSVDGLLEIRGQNNTVDVRITTSPRGLLRVADGASVEFTSADIRSEVSLGANSSVYFGEPASIGDGLSLALGDNNLTASSVVGAEQLTVSGVLAVDASAASEVAAGQVYHLFEADSLNVGLFEYDLPDLPGTLEFLPQMTETELSLLVIDTAVTLPGDCNSDGLVDAADYTLIRDNVSSDAQQLDLMVWRTNYGRMLALGSQPIPEPIPEPTTAAIGLVALALATSGFRRAA
ncbi:hypothetical protein Pla108_15460 [Botrimarina colliarenosi]|uniref:PEP-CTERM protein-sorting domain-containing protein n=1 Tax=Botrimarina colliarenosi TaxID=2528001 RepID=A0A5C6AQZ2_9BACT|nr:hypothetical protein [Botrimarina colliarenosi]TWU00594.1 hypothetical protein Pla108_15460 [Botrimarina colliarenosi]